jgi:hypothetical protein
MGERTYARTISCKWSPEPKSDGEHQADARDIKRQKQALELITLSVFDEAARVREIWPRKDWELAAKVENDLTQEYGKTPTPQELTEGFKAACLRYKKKNGSGLFTPKNLRDGLKQHKDGLDDQRHRRPRSKSKISLR